MVKNSLSSASMKQDYTGRTHFPLKPLLEFCTAQSLSPEDSGRVISLSRYISAVAAHFAVSLHTLKARLRRRELFKNWMQGETAEKRSSTGLLKPLSGPTACRQTDSKIHYGSDRDILYILLPVRGGYLFLYRKLSLSQQCALPGARSSSRPGCNSKSTASRLREMVLPVLSMHRAKAGSCFGLPRTRNGVQVKLSTKRLQPRKGNILQKCQSQEWNGEIPSSLPGA